MENVLAKMGITILVVVYMIVGLVVELIGRSFGFDEQFRYMLVNVIILVYFIINIKSRNIVIDTCQNFVENFKWKEILKISIVLALCIRGISLISLYTIDQIRPELLVELPNGVSTSAVSTIFLRINASFIAPIVEELIFRGVILNRLAPKWGLTVGIIISSVVFGLGHFPDCVSTFFCGIFLCVFYIEKQNILFPIVIHLINNLSNTIIICLLFILGSDISDDAITSDSSDLIVGIVLVIPTMLYIIKYLKQNWFIKNTQIDSNINQQK